MLGFLSLPPHLTEWFWGSNAVLMHVRQALHQPSCSLSSESKVLATLPHRVPGSHTLLSGVGRKNLSEFCAILGTQLLFLLSLGLVFNIVYAASVSMLVMLNSYCLS